MTTPTLPAYGSRYAMTYNEPMAKIFHRVMVDLQTAMQTGLLPSDLKVGMGNDGDDQKIILTVKEAPYPVRREPTKDEMKDYSKDLLPLSEEAWEVQKTLHAIANAYNYDGSEEGRDTSEKRYHTIISHHKDCAPHDPWNSPAMW
jgi:hypothetical protein